MIPAVGSILIAVSVVPVANLLRAVQFQWAPPGQDMLGGEAEKLLQGSLASVLFALAVVPGICEELLFRGFLLSGLRQKLSVFVSVVIVGLIFGLFHMYMEKIPVHSLIGMVLALICLRCGSIVPAVLVHIANNALPLIATRHEAVGRFFAMPETEQALVTPTVDARMAVFIAAFLLGIVLLQVRATARPANQ